MSEAASEVSRKSKLQSLLTFLLPRICVHTLLLMLRTLNSMLLLWSQDMSSKLKILFKINFQLTVICVVPSREQANFEVRSPGSFNYTIKWLTNVYE